MTKTASLVINVMVLWKTTAL